MPLWKIAWRSIQQRSFASALTMLSMALGVMLVVAVLLIVGVVDESFKSNSSLGYDTIVGPKGGELQLTMNTVYYLSQPVENVPYSFYQEFLPSWARDETPHDAKSGVHYENKLEWKTNADWQVVGDGVTIPPGEDGVKLRIPLISSGPIEQEKKFTLKIKVDKDSKAHTSTTKKSAVATIWPDQIPVVEPDTSKPDTSKPDTSKPDTSKPDTSKPDTLKPDTLKPDTSKPDTSAPDTLQTNPQQAARAKDTKSDSDVVADGASADGESKAREVEKFVRKPRPSVNINAVDVTMDMDYVEFEVTLTDPIEEPITFEASLFDGIDGVYVEFLDDEKISAVPVCLGDWFGHFRVVGTTADFFLLMYDRTRKRSYQFADGGNFTGAGSRGVFEAILGAKVARDQGLQVGDDIQPAHGAPEGKTHDKFEVVGVLEPSGTPQDRGVFVNMEGFNQITDHIREDGMKEVTALLVDTKNPFASMQLQEKLASGDRGQAVKPVKVIFGLFSRIVGPIRNLLLVITGLICVVSGISILVSIYNSMSDRRHEIAIMRSLGAGRSTVMTVVLLESVMISLVGGLLGWLAGHALIGLASGKIEGETGVVVSALDLAPPMEQLSYLLGEDIARTISVEIWLIPSLILLSVLVGFLPALSAYRTDVAESLQSSP